MKLGFPANFSFFVILAVLGIIGCSTQESAGDITPVGESAGWLTYEKHGFALGYPPDITFTEDKQQIRSLSYIPVCDTETLVACFYYARQEYQDTNFEAAGLSVNLIENSSSDTCNVSELIITETPKTREINGVTFDTGIGGVGALGHQATDYVLRTFHRGTCVEVKVTITTSEYANYPPGTVREFTDSDREKVLDLFDRILATLRFSDL